LLTKSEGGAVHLTLLGEGAAAEGGAGSAGALAFSAAAGNAALPADSDESVLAAPSSAPETAGSSATPANVGTPVGGQAKSHGGAGGGDAGGDGLHADGGGSNSSHDAIEGLEEDAHGDALSLDGASSVGGFEAAGGAMPAAARAAGGSRATTGGAVASASAGVGVAGASGAAANGGKTARRNSGGGGSEASFGSFDVNGDPNGLSLAGRIRSMASGLLGTISVPPTTAAATANANMTAAERIELARALAAAAVQLADEAWVECLQGWAALAKAREGACQNFAASAVIFAGVERKRVSELSDSLRRYAVFISSMHANLQVRGAAPRAPTGEGRAQGGLRGGPLRSSPDPNPPSSPHSRPTSPAV